MKNKITNPNIVKRKSRVILKLSLFFLVLVFISCGIFFLVRFIESYVNRETSISNLHKQWNSYNYQSVYDISSNILIEKPFNNTALMLHGYSAFYLALSQVDSSSVLSLLDEAIINIRLAHQSAKSKTRPQLEYMLGKAYFYKNNVSSYYYYADLAVKYLNMAIQNGYKSEDIPEFLGLSYAALDMTLESISSFTKALLYRESEMLLLSIGEQYFKAGQYTASEQYLFRISQDCKDDKILIKCHNILGQIYIEQQRLDEAEVEFNIILQKNENSADAYYGLGVIYEIKGDMIKARSQWRKALQIQANHPGALKKISEYK